MKCEPNHCWEVCPLNNALALVYDFGSITLRKTVHSLDCENKGKGLQNQHDILLLQKDKLTHI